MNKAMTTDEHCPHGHALRRKCSVCSHEDDQTELTRLRDENERMITAIRGYVTARIAGKGHAAAYWMDLQEIAKRNATEAPPGETCEQCGTYIHPGASHVCLR